MSIPRQLAVCAFSVLISASAWALDVNSATEAQLDSVKGLGPSSTGRILQAREAGPFKDWADFMARVKGIKGSAASKLSAEGLTVNGAPFNTKGTSP
nr:helix-hairpin-helix domain-containing protein [uncultured Rhodoferax sp.]